MRCEAGITAVQPVAPALCDLTAMKQQTVSVMQWWYTEGPCVRRAVALLELTLRQPLPPLLPEPDEPDEPAATWTRLASAWAAG